MSKQVILVRHGNAKSGAYGVDDFDRALDSKGVEEAQEMAFRLKNRKLIPKVIISSPAIRAISTARIFAGIWDKQPESILLENAIYESNIPRLLKIVNNLAESEQSLVLFGHNPEISAFADYLTDEDLYSLPTCGVAIINFEVDRWEMITKGTGTMLLFDFPGADNTL